MVRDWGSVVDVVPTLTELVGHDALDDSRDVASAEPEVVDRLAAVLEEWTRDTDDVTATPHDDDYVALRGLGYRE